MEAVLLAWHGEILWDVYEETKNLYVWIISPQNHNCDGAIVVSAEKS